MNIFNRRKQTEEVSASAIPAASIVSADLPEPTEPAESHTGELAEMALSTIHDGVIITDANCHIQYMNPAALSMTEADASQGVAELDCGDVMILEDKDGRAVSKDNNELIIAIKSGRPLEKIIYLLVPKLSKKKIPVAISVVIVNNGTQNRIITFRNVSKELEEENKQAEFISTASHEMRTPVAAIDGYISLALNPQTATIDARAKGYLESASKSSKHLGRLFQDLLDVTKLDDGRVRSHPEPIEIVSLVKQMVAAHMAATTNSGLNLEFGTKENAGASTAHRIEQVIYSYADTGFLQEIVDNLVENAIKYTPSGGSVRVGVRGDKDKVIIEVSDTGIGISQDDLQHIFQKFYRVDNSDTRTIGGTGLGLYIVKQRVEAMDGHVWAESIYGNGSTFFVSLPRLSSEEYEKRKVIFQNANAMSAAVNAASGATVSSAIISNAESVPGIAPNNPSSLATPSSVTSAPPITPPSATSPSTITPPTLAAPPSPTTPPLDNTANKLNNNLNGGIQ